MPPITLICISDFFFNTSSNFSNLLGETNKIIPSIIKTKLTADRKSSIFYLSPSALPKNSKKSLFGDKTIVVSPSVKALL